MTAALITLSAAVLALGGALAFVIVRRQPTADLVDELVTHGKAQLAAERALHEAERQRDDALAAAKTNEVTRQRALELLDRTVKERDAALEEARRHVAERLRSAGVADAARLVDELLAQVPGVPVSGDAGADGGGGASTAVQPAAVARRGEP